MNSFVPHVNVQRPTNKLYINYNIINKIQHTCHEQPAPELKLKSVKGASSQTGSVSHF